MLVPKAPKCLATAQAGFRAFPLYPGNITRNNIDQFSAMPLAPHILVLDLELSRKVIQINLCVATGKLILFSFLTKKGNKLTDYKSLS